MPRRPFGVSVVAALFGASVIINAAFALLSVVSYPTVARVLWTVTILRSHGPAMLLSLGPLLPLFFLAAALFLASIAIGLVQLRNWARMGAMVVLLVFFVISLMQVALATHHARPLVLAEFVLRLCVTALVLLYLSQPRVRGAFRNPAYERRRSPRRTAAA